MQNKQRRSTGFLSVFSLVMITVGSVDSVRNLPATALFGSSVIFFFLLAAVCFLLPAALVSAELSVRYPGQGGVYRWVSNAFGSRAGVLAVWFQWIENVIWYPTILSFIAGSIGYLISPDLASNKLFIITVILCAFWGVTLVNLMGMKMSAYFAEFCSIVGLFVPMLFIIGLGAYWFIQGHPTQVVFTKETLLPDLSRPDMWVSLTGIILSLCGIEIATVHAGDVENPKKAFPRALIYSTLIIVVTLILGALSIAIVIPEKNISLISGIMQAFHTFFSAYHLTWLLPVMAICLVAGGLGSVNNWVIAPTRGLLLAAQDGHLPSVFATVNRHNAPNHLLCYQAVIVTGVALIFYLMPSVNASYWLLTALAGQLYMFMYILMFLAAIYCRYKDKRQLAFEVPGGLIGISLIACVGIVSCIGTIIIGFIPPYNMPVGGRWHYDALVLGGLLLTSLPPFIIFLFHKLEMD